MNRDERGIFSPGLLMVDWLKHGRREKDAARFIFCEMTGDLIRPKHLGELGDLFRKVTDKIIADKEEILEVARRVEEFHPEWIMKNTSIGNDSDYRTAFVKLLVRGAHNKEKREGGSSWNKVKWYLRWFSTKDTGCRPLVDERVLRGGDYNGSACRKGACATQFFLFEKREDIICEALTDIRKSVQENGEDMKMFIRGIGELMSEFEKEFGFGREGWDNAGF